MWSNTKVANALFPFRIVPFLHLQEIKNLHYAIYKFTSSSEVWSSTQVANTHRYTGKVVSLDLTVLNTEKHYCLTPCKTSLVYIARFGLRCGSQSKWPIANLMSS